MRGCLKRLPCRGHFTLAAIGISKDEQKKGCSFSGKQMQSGEKIDCALKASSTFSIRFSSDRTPIVSLGGTVLPGPTTQPVTLLLGIDSPFNMQTAVRIRIMQPAYLLRPTTLFTETSQI